MTPAQLLPSSFAAYGPAARAFAVEHLGLLQAVPLVICPSFLQQIQAFDTSFPAERESLLWQFNALQSMPPDQRERFLSPFRTLTLPIELQNADWVHNPAAFIADLTAFLWSSGEMPKFRAAAQELFAATPPRSDNTHRLVIVLLGQGTTPQQQTILRKLRKHGVFLSALESASAPEQIAAAVRQHAGAAPSDYASWYIDGGSAHPALRSLPAHTVTVSYPDLAPLRGRVLDRMQATISSGAAGAELMRTRLADTTAHDVDAAAITPDPILGRFYTELFTLSSGPQIFSTSFVQWTGRELARRAQPATLLLRYAPRQQHHDLNELFAKPDSGVLDPQASLRDAEMGAYLNWIEMNRISQPGKLTFAAVVEGQPYAVIVGSGARPATLSTTPISFQHALQTFG